MQNFLLFIVPDENFLNHRKPDKNFVEPQGAADKVVGQVVLDEYIVEPPIMKVTVCFHDSEDTKLVVPCGDGQNNVKELIEEAFSRYKKKISKSAESCWLNINNMKLSLSDGGILDPDDRVCDVLDDKEQIMAIFEEHPLLSGHHNNGDGTSRSSAGTSSPDVFAYGDHAVLGNGGEVNKTDQNHESDDSHDIIITSRDLHAGSNLVVRRGSEPALNKINRDDDSRKGIKKEGRSDPVGSPAVSNQSDARMVNEQPNKLHVVFDKSSDPLGIHVIPDFDDQSKNVGLRIQSIEETGRACRDGRLKVNDQIVQINEKSLYDVDFAKAQDIFREAMKAPHLQLQVIRPENMPKMNDSEIQTPSKRAPPPPPPLRNPRTKLTFTQSDSTQNISSSRISLRTISIHLIKGASGFGFTITTLENAAPGSNAPVYVKQILSKGAAMEDGRLQSGDVILEINGVPLTNKSKSDVVSILSALPQGSSVNLIISRQDGSFEQRSDSHSNSNSANAEKLSSSEAVADVVRSTSSTVKSTDSNITSRNSSYTLDFGPVGKDYLYHSMMELNRVGIDSVDNLGNDEETEAAGYQGTIGTSGSMSLNKSRKSISMEDMRVNNARYEEITDDEFDDDEDDEDLRESNFYKARDFNQSFRAAVDKSYDNPPISSIVFESVMKNNKLNELKDKEKKNKDKGKKFGWFFGFGKQKKKDEKQHKTTDARNTKKDLGGRERKDECCQTPNGEISQLADTIVESSRTPGKNISVGSNPYAVIGFGSDGSQVAPNPVKPRDSKSPVMLQALTTPQHVQLSRSKSSPSTTVEEPVYSVVQKRVPTTKQPPQQRFEPPQSNNRPQNSPQQRFEPPQSNNRPQNSPQQRFEPPQFNNRPLDSPQQRFEPPQSNNRPQDSPQQRFEPPQFNNRPQDSPQQRFDSPDFAPHVPPKQIPQSNVITRNPPQQRYDPSNSRTHDPPQQIFQPSPTNIRPHNLPFEQLNQSRSPRTVDHRTDRDQPIQASQQRLDQMLHQELDYRISGFQVEPREPVNSALEPVHPQARQRETVRPTANHRVPPFPIQRNGSAYSPIREREPVVQTWHEPNHELDYRWRNPQMEQNDDIHQRRNMESNHQPRSAHPSRPYDQRFEQREPYSSRYTNQGQISPVEQNFADSRRMQPPVYKYYDSDLKIVVNSNTPIFPESDRLGSQNNRFDQPDYLQNNFRGGTQFSPQQELNLGRYNHEYGPQGRWERGQPYSQQEPSQNLGFNNNIATKDTVSRMMQDVQQMEEENRRLKAATRTQHPPTNVRYAQNSYPTHPSFMYAPTQQNGERLTTGNRSDRYSAQQNFVPNHSQQIVTSPR